MTWDNGRELKSFTKDNVTTTYNYDSNGMRVRKNGANGKTQYYYDSNNMLVGTHFDNNTPSNTNDDTVVQFYYDTEGSPISFRVNGSDPYFYVKNLQGDIEKIINVDGETLVDYIYDAWGNVTSVVDNSANNLSTLNPFRYRGYVYDNESGLYYLQSRYYDPQTGRFLNADVYFDTETGTVLSTNMYAYCENSPVVGVDPTGQYNIKKFNCYAYAFGISNKWLIPGKKLISKYNKYGRERKNMRLPAYYSVNQVVKWVIKDFGKDKVRKLNNKKSKLKKGEYLIAVRVCIYYESLSDNIIGPPSPRTYDFHFWKKDWNGMWWHKVGDTPIELLGLVNPDNSNKWGIYNSKTLYLAYKGKLWVC